MKVFKWAKKVIGFFIKPSIVFESQPVLSDNTKAVYDEMVRCHFDKKYYMVWTHSWEDWVRFDNNKEIHFNPRQRNTLRQSILNYSVFYKTKCIICCNQFIPSSGEGQITYGKNQKSFYLSHGTPLKKTKPYYTSSGGIDFAVSASENTREVMSQEFSISINNYYATGFPRNDVFSKEPINLCKFFGGSYRKIIIWYPTFRQGTNLILKGDALPIIHNEQYAVQLNEVAKKNNVLIVLKPHFAQNLNYLREITLSNICFINDEFFVQNSITSYEMLASSDALITDYSSVYFDYTLRDKPIGVVWEDVNEYKINPGFALDLEEYMKGAEKIYTIKDLCEFVQRVSDNKDVLKEERREIRDKVNISLDGKNTERVVSFIIEKAGL